MKRVVITGMGGVTALGQDGPGVMRALQEGRGAVRRMPEWAEYQGLRTQLAAPAADFEKPPHYGRKALRTMGRVSVLAVRASELALEQAELSGDPSIRDGRMGVAYGSSTGSPDAIREFFGLLDSYSTAGISATGYLRMMGHTAPVNIAVHFGLQGRVITTSSACTSGSQGIGYAFEAIRSGRQALMLAGGAEELSVTEAAVFDTLYATSTCNDEPGATPRPFDAGRDGLVIGEGAATLVLEDLEHARARGATILGEIAGFATNCDGAHVTRPSEPTMGTVMRMALADAGLDPQAIGYVNAHATATEHGDIAEARVTREVFGDAVPVSSLKGHFGHTLGACSAIESWLTLEMLRGDWYAPTLHLERLDPRCEGLDYIMGQGRTQACEYVMNNNFAFGGINTSLIFRRWE